MAKIEPIQNDEQYNAMLARLVKGAAMIDDPLSTDAEKTKYHAAFMRIWKEIEDYRLRTRGVSYYPEGGEGDVGQSTRNQK